MHVRVYSIDTSLILNDLRESSVKMRRIVRWLVGWLVGLLAGCVLGLVRLIACNLLIALTMMEDGSIRVSKIDWSGR